MATGNINIHALSLLTGGATLARALSPALTAGGSVWDRLNAVGTALMGDSAYQRDLALGTLAYMGVRSVRSSVEPKPLMQIGRLRAFVL